MVDLLFFLAVGALGWGLSLATYRSVAQLNGWPLGATQTALPALTLATGLLSALTGLIFAIARGLQLAFDKIKAFSEFPVRFFQGCFGLYVEFPGQINDDEQQISKLFTYMDGILVFYCRL